MAEHGGNEPIHDGDNTPKERISKALQEALYDLTLGAKDMNQAHEYVMDAVEKELGKERA